MRMTIATIGLAGAIAVGGSYAAAETAGPVNLVDPERVADAITVTDVRNTGTEVIGRVVNRTGDTVRDVRLLIGDNFVWSKERSPGNTPPGFADTITVSDAIPPGGSVTFRTPRPEQPPRTDGHFETEVKVLGFTSQRDATSGQRDAAPADRMGVR